MGYFLKSMFLTFRRLKKIYIRMSIREAHLSFQFSYSFQQNDLRRIKRVFPVSMDVHEYMCFAARNWIGINCTRAKRRYSMIFVNPYAFLPTFSTHYDVILSILMRICETYCTCVGVRVRGLYFFFFFKAKFWKRDLVWRGNVISEHPLDFYRGVLASA